MFAVEKSASKRYENRKMAKDSAEKRQTSCYCCCATLQGLQG